MAKISSYPELFRVVGGAKIVSAYRGKNYSDDLFELHSKMHVSGRYGIAFRDDFWNTTFYKWIWGLLAVGVGTVSMIASEANHPGITRITQNGANTGYKQIFNYDNTILLRGNETTELVFRLQTVTALVMYFGFFDSAMVDGAYMNVAGATLSGITRDNSLQSTTATTYALSTATWYRARVEVSSDAGQVDFYLYSAAGAELWHDSIATTIPKVAGREVAHGVYVAKTSAGVVALADIDLMTLTLPWSLRR